MILNVHTMFPNSLLCIPEITKFLQTPSTIQKGPKKNFLQKKGLGQRNL